MKETLKDNGWVMYYQCNCSGGRQHWNNKAKPGYEVRTRTKNKTFSILLNNRVVSGPNWEYELADKLKQYV
jgi:hypothetical protein